MYADVCIAKALSMVNAGDIFAVRNGRKIICDLDSVDAYYVSLPPIGRRSLTASDLGLPDEPDAPLALHLGGGS